ncbi:hypothetical protein SS50377_26089 [Spironucleus salmonicida]|uniref:Uncharacterized protein n=1 Tax=Spironucleus salmonicida TaxID=348837 RepID=A0A9P8LPL5_9EUKA|nr:hypothetical protein SS50377_26089 [Spironucleus salmonicida]
MGNLSVEDYMEGEQESSEVEFEIKFIMLYKTVLAFFDSQKLLYLKFYAMVGGTNQNTSFCNLLTTVRRINSFQHQFDSFQRYQLQPGQNKFS